MCVVATNAAKCALCKYTNLFAVRVWNILHKACKVGSGKSSTGIVTWLRTGKEEGSWIRSEGLSPKIDKNGCDAPLVNWHPSPFSEAKSADAWSRQLNWMLCQSSECVELNFHFPVCLHCVYTDNLILRRNCEVNSLAHVRGLCNIGRRNISAFIRVTLE